MTGASSGIGRAAALRLAQEEANLHLLGRDQEGLAEVARKARTWGGEAHIYPVDLLQDASVEAGLEALTARVGGVDVLIHSAGVVSLAPLEAAPLGDLERQFALNVRAPYLLTQHLLPLVVRAKGQVVFVNSGAGLHARAGWSQYAASKHALKAVADSLREEVKGRGVRVMSLYPGRTASPMQRRVHELEGKPYDPARFVQPEDVAQLLASALLLPATAEVTDLSVRPGLA